MCLAIERCLSVARDRTVSSFSLAKARDLIRPSFSILPLLGTASHCNQRIVEQVISSCSNQYIVHCMYWHILQHYRFSTGRQIEILVSELGINLTIAVLVMLSRTEAVDVSKTEKLLFIRRICASKMKILCTLQRWQWASAGRLTVGRRYKSLL